MRLKIQIREKNQRNPAVSELEATVEKLKLKVQKLETGRPRSSSQNNISSISRELMQRDRQNHSQQKIKSEDSERNGLFFLLKVRNFKDASRSVQNLLKTESNFQAAGKFIDKLMQYVSRHSESALKYPISLNTIWKWIKAHTKPEKAK